MKKWSISNLYDSAMTGVSYFLPVIVAGGIIGGVAPLFGGAVSTWLAMVGATVFSMVLPVLAGYTALAIADRPGLVPGLVAGLLAFSGGSGMLGALLGGLAAGFIMFGLKLLTKAFPRSLEATKTLVLFPIVGTILAALVMIPINQLAPLNSAFCGFINNLSLPFAIILSVVLCAAIALDLGGPVNKAVYLFSLATLMQADGSLVPSLIMGSIAASGMTIASGCGLATTLFSKKYGESMRASGKEAYIMGLSFICEGALPFAERDAKRVYPALVLGSVTAGVIAAVCGITMPAPIGGLFTIPLVNNIPVYMLAVVVGTILNGVVQGLLARTEKNADDEE